MAFSGNTFQSTIYVGQSSDLAAPKSGDAVLYYKNGQLTMRNATSILQVADKAWADGKFVQLAGGTMTGELVLSAAQSLAPNSPNSAISKAWAEQRLQGIRWKDPVDLASKSPETLADLFDGASFGGSTLATGMRILLMGQSTASQNGIYVVAASGAPSRALDADTALELTSACTVCNAGTYAGKGFLQTAVLSSLSDSEVWTQNFGSSLYSASGEGIEIVAGLISLELDGGTLSKSSSGLKVADGGIANLQIAAAAAIAWSKMASLTPSRLLVSDESGVLGVSSVTATEAGYLSGVTSAIQTQLDSKLPKAGGTMTGDLLLSADTPAQARSAAPKTYVQSQVGNITYDVQEETGSAVSLNVSTVSPKIRICSNSAERTVTISGGTAGANFVEIKDGANNAYTNNITVTLDASGTFEDGVSTSLIINSDGASVRLVRSGTKWFQL